MLRFGRLRHGTSCVEDAGQLTSELVARRQRCLEGHTWGALIVIAVLYFAAAAVSSWIWPPAHVPVQFYLMPPLVILTQTMLTVFFVRASRQLTRELSRTYGALTESQLRAARNEAVATMAATIPHEVNQPLAEVLGYAEIIRHRTLTKEEMETYCDRIATASRQVADVVQRLSETSHYSVRMLGEQTVVDLGARG
ncbi:MAG: hypothetical protein EPO21_23230 [Chloroflexota bacterium]|nr:MAG: hypothetical protein EPO21_23230 [Chloroflexota bacterium]